MTLALRLRGWCASGVLSDVFSYNYACFTSHSVYTFNKEIIVVYVNGISISIPSNVTSRHFNLGNHFRTLLLIDT